MIRQSITATFFMMLVSNAAMAADGIGLDLTAIEALEREQIIKELSYRLDTEKNCNAIPNWDDAGSGADQDGFFFTPKVSNNEFIIGGHASQKRRSKSHCVLTVSVPQDNPKGTPPLLVKPKDWQRVWIDKGSGAAKDGAFWNAVPPDNNYVCIGSMSTTSHGQKPSLPNYRCVHKNLTEKVTAKNRVWTDKGSGANSPVAIFQLPKSEAFVAVPERASQVSTFDLRQNLNASPDPGTVDALLVARMDKIRADLKAQEEAKIAEIKQQKEAEKLKEEAEQQKLAEAAEKKAKAAEAEKKKQQEAKALEEMRIKEEKRKALEAAAVAKETETPAEVAEVTTEPAPTPKPKQETVQTELPDLIDDSDPFFSDEPAKEVVEEAETTEPVASSDSEVKAPSGLDKLVNTFLKILAMMIGGLIFLMVAFKLAFGGKGKDKDNS